MLGPNEYQVGRVAECGSPVRFPQQYKFPPNPSLFLFVPVCCAAVDISLAALVLYSSSSIVALRIAKRVCSACASYVA